MGGGQLEGPNRLHERPQPRLVPLFPAAPLSLGSATGMHRSEDLLGCIICLSTS
jgi:hypothetical protein